MFQCIKGCKADCCGVIPIPKKTYKRHRQDIQRKVEKKFDLDKDVLLLTDDGFCGFLDSIGRCVIYNERPLVCKLYGIEQNLPCPYVRSDGIPRQKDEVKMIQDKIITTVNMAISKLRGA